jgi:hypothetical protein
MSVFIMVGERGIITDLEEKRETLSYARARADEMEARL